MRRRHYAVVAAVCLALPLFALSFHGDSIAAEKPAATSKAASGIDREPPEPVYEVTPGERPGYLWTPGYWTANNDGRFVWSAGHWIAERPGYTWVPAGWEQRADKWYFVKGYWEENEVTAEAEEAVTDEHPAKPRKAIKKRAKKMDYSNTKIWPKVTRH